MSLISTVFYSDSRKKIYFTKSIKGINYAKPPPKSETFADDTSIMTKLTETNLRNPVGLISDFAKIRPWLSHLEESLE